MTKVQLFDDTQCSLGEGPLWHPLREEFFWFDINAHRLYARKGEARRVWQFDEYVSAAGWISHEQMLIASETRLFLFDLETDWIDPICELEADNPATRSNDGRADPYGGFWIGTMGKRLQPDAGAIYRYYRGEVRRLYAPWTVPNTMCFTPDGGHAYLADTPTGRIWRQSLDKDGWPAGEPEVFLDLPEDSYRPDGAVVDTAGNLWCAHYGHSKVTCHGPDGVERFAIPIQGKNTTCPAFGGDDMRTLFVTTASQGIEDPGEAEGCTYCVPVEARGQAEHRVIL